MSDVPAGRRTTPGPADWWAGARPRTLTIGAVPVAVGAAAAGHPSAIRTLGALLVAVTLQIGANYANDYFDGVRGVDTEQRVGPARLVAGRRASANSVLTASAMALTAAALVGVWLALASGEGRLIILGGAALGAAVLYTGGPKPYAGIGIADVAVFVFFGLFATVGTTIIEIGHATKESWWSSIPVGLLAVAVLVANNLRDLETDAAAGRRTSVVRLGLRRSRLLFQALVWGAMAVPVVGAWSGQLPIEALAVLACIPLARSSLRIVGTGSGGAVGPALKTTATLHLAVGIVLTVALAVATWVT